MQASRWKARAIQWRGVLRETWSRIVSDEAGRIRGQREQLVGYLRERAAGRTGYRSER